MMNARIIGSGRHTPRGGSSVGLLREWRATSGAVALLAVCRLKPITAAMKAHLPTREHLLIQPGEPWAPYVTPEAKRGARAAIADAEELIPFV